MVKDKQVLTSLPCKLFSGFFCLFNSLYGCINIIIRNTVAEKCDIFMGDWIADESGPAYTNESCHVIEGHQNCMRNGRPDSGYLYWRWNPLNCKLPRFNSERFLDVMRNKSWAFIGDSISRNHVQSLLCILSQVLFKFFRSFKYMML